MNCRAAARNPALPKRRILARRPALARPIYLAVPPQGNGGFGKAAAGRRYQVAWSPSQQGVLATCAFDRSVQIHSISSGSGTAPEVAPEAFWRRLRLWGEISVLLVQIQGPSKTRKARRRSIAGERFSSVRSRSRVPGLCGFL